MPDELVLISGGGIGGPSAALARAALPNQIMGAKSPSQWYDLVDWICAAEDLLAATTAAQRSAVDA